MAENNQIDTLLDRIRTGLNNVVNWQLDTKKQAQEFEGAVSEIKDPITKAQFVDLVRATNRAKLADSIDTKSKAVDEVVEKMTKLHNSSAINIMEKYFEKDWKHQLSQASGQAFGSPQQKDETQPQKDEMQQLNEVSTYLEDALADTFLPRDVNQARREEFKADLKQFDPIMKAKLLHMMSFYASEREGSLSERGAYYNINWKKARQNDNDNIHSYMLNKEDRSLIAASMLDPKFLGGNRQAISIMAKYCGDVAQQVDTILKVPEQVIEPYMQENWKEGIEKIGTECNGLHPADNLDLMSDTAQVMRLVYRAKDDPEKLQALGKELGRFHNAVLWEVASTMKDGEKYLKAALPAEKLAEMNGFEDVITKKEELSQAYMQSHETMQELSKELSQKTMQELGKEMNKPAPQR
ncbi:MAG: hypothetical protein IKQ31_01475 [Clostridia bacterium]|nr:hypothetical protein [Clostridia bacterium]